MIPEAGHAIPRDYDAIVFGVAPPATGGGTDGDPPTSPPASNASCYIPEAHTFAGIQLQNQYLGTVTVQDTTVAWYLEIRTGAIDQQATTDGSYADLFVTDGFDFTGGVLNNTNARGLVHLDSVALATIGLDNVTVTTGSDLLIEDGTTLSYSLGTIAFSNVARMEVLGGSTVLPTSDGAQVGQGFIQINAPANATPRSNYDSSGSFYADVDQKCGLMVEGTGKVYFQKLISVLGHAVDGDATSASFVMTGGQTYGYNGFQVTVQHGFAVSGGQFVTVYNSGSKIGQTFFIIGDMKMTGGALTIGVDASEEPNPGVHFSALHVQGNSEFTGGTFNTRVMGIVGSAERDWWKTTGTFKITAAATIAITVKSAPPGGTGNQFWNVIEADGEFTDGSALPTVTNGWDVAFNNANKKIRVSKS